MQRGLVALLLLPLAATATAQIPPRSISAPKEEVDDAFLSYLHGILYQEAELWIDGPTLQHDFPEFVPTRHTPFNDIELMTWAPSAAGAPGGGRFTVQFSVPLRYDVPVDILGHHPVELQGSQVISFEESLRQSHTGGGRASQTGGITIPPEVTRLLVLRLVAGYMRVDFAPWLDFISGRLIEDVDVMIIAIARYRERWFAVLGGTSPDERPMTGILDMKTSRFLVSPPRLLTRLARELIELTPPDGSEVKIEVAPGE